MITKYRNPYFFAFSSASKLASCPSVSRRRSIDKKGPLSFLSLPNSAYILLMDVFTAKFKFSRRENDFRSTKREREESDGEQKLRLPSLYTFFLFMRFDTSSNSFVFVQHIVIRSTKDSFEEAAWKETASIFVPRDSKHSSSIAWHSRRKASKMTRTNFPPFNGKQFGRKAQDAPREGQGSKEGTGGGNE